MNDYDYVALIHDFASRKNGKVALFPTPSGGWCVRVTAKDPAHTAEAKGRSPQAAYKTLAQKLKLEVKVEGE